MLVLCQCLPESDDQKEVHVPQAVLARYVVGTGIKGSEVGVEFLLVEQVEQLRAVEFDSVEEKERMVQAGNQ